MLETNICYFYTLFLRRAIGNSKTEMNIVASMNN